MKPLSNELKDLLKGRIDLAPPAEIMAITAALTTIEQVNGVRSESVVPYTASPSKRFDLIDDDEIGQIIRDATTRLEWTRSHIGEGRMSWADAKKACEELGDGWRLPSIKELLTLVDYERTEPAIDPIFKCESAAYWTSTPWASSPSVCAWYVYFRNGYSHYYSQDAVCFVRAVRSSQ